MEKLTPEKEYWNSFEKIIKMILDVSDSPNWNRMIATVDKDIISAFIRYEIYNSLTIWAKAVCQIMGQNSIFNEKGLFSNIDEDIIMYSIVDKTWSVFCDKHNASSKSDVTDFCFNIRNGLVNYFGHEDTINTNFFRFNKEYSLIHPELRPVLLFYWLTVIIFNETGLKEEAKYDDNYAVKLIFEGNISLSYYKHIYMDCREKENWCSTENTNNADDKSVEEKSKRNNFVKSLSSIGIDPRQYSEEEIISLYKTLVGIEKAMKEKYLIPFSDGDDEHMISRADAAQFSINQPNLCTQEDEKDLNPSKTYGHKSKYFKFLNLLKPDKISAEYYLPETGLPFNCCFGHVVVEAHQRLYSNIPFEKISNINMVKSLAVSSLSRFIYLFHKFCSDRYIDKSKYKLKDKIDQIISRTDDWCRLSETDEKTERNVFETVLAISQLRTLEAYAQTNKVTAKYLYENYNICTKDINGNLIPKWESNGLYPIWDISSNPLNEKTLDLLLTFYEVDHNQDTLSLYCNLITQCSLQLFPHNVYTGKTTSNFYVSMYRTLVNIENGRYPQYTPLPFYKRKAKSRKVSAMLIQSTFGVEDSSLLSSLFEMQHFALYQYSQMQTYYKYLGEVNSALLKILKAHHENHVQAMIIASNFLNTIFDKIYDEYQHFEIAREDAIEGIELIL